MNVIEENGAETDYTYDPANPYNRLTEKSPLGYTTAYAYDANGNVVSVTTPRGATATSSDFTAFNQPQKVKDTRGNFTVLKYDARGNLVESMKLKSGVTPAIPYTPVAAQMLAWAVNGYDTYGNLTSAKRVRDFAAQIAAPSATSPTGPLIVTTFDANALYPTAIARQGDKTGDGLFDRCK